MVEEKHMITFKQFISEEIINAWTEEVIPDDKLMDFIRQHCSRSFDTAMNGSRLYRGFSGRRGFGISLKDSAIVIDMSNSERTSADTNNIYQVLMDKSPNLSHVPPRSKSLICSTNLTTAKSYDKEGGSTYVILPFDEVDTIARGVEVDFINTKIGNSKFRNNKSDELTLNQFSNRLDDIFVALKIGYNLFTYPQDKIVGILEDLPLQVMYYLDSEFNKTGLLFKQGGKFNELYMRSRMNDQADLNELTEDDLTVIGKKFLALYRINPIKALSEFAFTNDLGIKIGNINGLFRPDAEVWFTGKALCINIDLWLSIFWKQ